MQDVVYENESIDIEQLSNASYRDNHSVKNVELAKPLANKLSRGKQDRNTEL